MVVRPTYIENNEDNRNTSPSPETFCHLTFPSSPVELQKEQMKLLQNDGMVHYAYIYNITQYYTKQYFRVTHGI